MPISTENIFMFPESYNLLRKELYEFWQTANSKIPFLYQHVSWYMAFDMVEFIDRMQDKLDHPIKVVPLTKDDVVHIDLVCTIFLTELRKRRGEVNP